MVKAPLLSSPSPLLMITSFFNFGDFLVMPEIGRHAPGLFQLKFIGVAKFHYMLDYLYGFEKYFCKF